MPRISDTAHPDLLHATYLGVMKWLILLALTLTGACDEQACSKCPPGTRVSDPGQFCSPCLPDDGGVRDAAVD